MPGSPHPRHRAVDGRRLSPVLPRPCRHLPGRRPRPSPCRGRRLRPRRPDTDPGACARSQKNGRRGGRSPRGCSGPTIAPAATSPRRRFETPGARDDRRTETSARQRRARRGSWWCSSTATAPTATTSSTSAGCSRPSSPTPPSSPPMRPSPATSRRWAGSGSRWRWATWTSTGAASSMPRRRSTPSSMPSSPASALTDRDLALVGFSQGTMMALHVGLRRKGADRRHPRLFGPARRARAARRAGRQQGPDPARPRRRRPGDPGRWRSMPRCSRWAPPASRRSGMSRAASPTASTRTGLRLGADFLRRVLAG